MSNNRLYIKDTESGDKILLAKRWGSGWVIYHSYKELNNWFLERDIEASHNGPTKLILETE